MPNETANARAVRLLDTDWRFTRGDPENAGAPDLDDGGWEAVEVPHDWSIEGPFDPENPGGQQQGFAPGGVGWYRRELPEDLDAEQVYLRFDGVYRDWDLSVDGEHVESRPYGYSPVVVDLSEAVEGGVSGGETVAVRVDNDTYPHSRWYTDSGIYRSVDLVETSKLHVRPWGTDVRTPSVNRHSAAVEVTTEVRNAGDSPADATLATEIVDPDGQVVATAEREVFIGSDDDETVDQRLSVADPQRWSPGDPTLYTARTVLERDGDAVDESETTFGVRTFAWTTDEGFVLNGETRNLKGVNLHHDAGCLGAAVPERALERRLETLNDLGCNAVRTAHNPPQRELLELCDEMGFLVIDEVYDKFRHEGVDEWFDDSWRADLEAMIRRDRNYPSVVCWSVGNESYDQGQDSMLEDLAMLAEATNELDPTRPVTYGNPPWGDGREGVVENIERVAEHVDVLSCNYQEHLYEGYREAGVDIPIVGSECRPFFRGSGDDPLAYVPRNPWYDVAEKDDVVGQFLWPGIDYLGESREWPSKGWPTGLIDTTGEPKPFSGFHRAAWSADPVLEVAAVDPERERPAARSQWSWPALSAHWTFPDRADSQSFVNVFTFTNADRVTLYQNDEYLGEQDSAEYESRPMEWYVPYESGTLRAVAEVDSEVVAERELETAGEAAGVELSVDRDAIDADGRDLTYVEATVVDDDGVRVPRATHEVAFDVSGQGEIAGVDNGDLDSDESWVGDSRSAYHGRCIAIVQADRESGVVEVSAEAEGLNGDSLTVSVEDTE